MIQNCLKSMKTLIRVQIKTIEYQVKVFEKKCESVFVTASVTDIFLLRILSLHLLPPVTAFVPTANTVTASIITNYAVSASLPIANLVSDLICFSRIQGGRPEGTTNDNKILTAIRIANAKNEIIDIVYQKKTELDNKKLLVGSPQKNIYEAAKNI